MGFKFTVGLRLVSGWFSAGQGLGWCGFSVEGLANSPLPFAYFVLFSSSVGLKRIYHCWTYSLYIFALFQGLIPMEVQIAIKGPNNMWFPILLGRGQVMVQVFASESMKLAKSGDLTRRLNLLRRFVPSFEPFWQMPHFPVPPMHGP